jgi:hypothetical protein
MAQTEAGYYIDVEPVSVVSAVDLEALQRAILKIIGNGNPLIPTPTRATFPRRHDRGWEDNPDRIESLQGVTADVVARRVAEVIKVALEMPND